MKPLESDDPMELVGVAHPLEVTHDEDLNMARCLIEEYALSGFTAFEIGNLFESPLYTLPHAIFLRRGEDAVRGLIREVFGVAK